MKIILFFLILSVSAIADDRAQSSWDSLVKNFWQESRLDFRGDNHYWHYAQSFDIAAMDSSRADFVQKLYVAQKKRGYFQTGTIYHDDENWMALALLRAYGFSGQESYLQTAKDLFARVMKAEVFDAAGNTRGVRWSSQNDGVATASNMGPVITAVKLFRITNEKQYLEFALRIYHHWKETMLVPETYQVVDFRKPDGTREFNIYTYDQGLMIGAAVELYRLSGDANYLTDARGLVTFISSHMTEKNILVEPKCRGNLPDCWKSNDIAQFKGITIKFMVELAKVDPEYALNRTIIDASVNSLWENGRDPITGRFCLEWDGSDVAGDSSYGAANSAAMALGAFAEL